MAEWRAGRSTGRTLWRDEQLVGMVDSPAIAAEIVEALNGRERYVEGGPEVDEQLAELSRLATAPRLNPPSGRERYLR